MNTHRDRMMKTIQDLLHAAPRINTGDRWALHCGIVLRGGGAMQGVLSTTDDGMLRMLSPMPIGANQREMRDRHRVWMVEQFFDYDDVMVIGVEREVRDPSTELFTG